MPEFSSAPEVPSYTAPAAPLAPAPDQGEGRALEDLSADLVDAGWR